MPAHRARPRRAPHAHASRTATARSCPRVVQVRLLRKGLEAQVGAMRLERRNQVIGYCVERAQWDARHEPLARPAIGVSPGRGSPFSSPSLKAGGKAGARTLR